MRTVSRLRLLFFSFYTYSGELSTSILVALSNLGQPHHKKICMHIRVINKNITINSYVFILPFYGGAGGIRTPVQNTFLVASYNYNKYYNTIML